MHELDYHNSKQPSSGESSFKSQNSNHLRVTDEKGKIPSRAQNTYKEDLKKRERAMKVGNDHEVSEISESELPIGFDN